MRVKNRRTAPSPSTADEAAAVRGAQTLRRMSNPEIVLRRCAAHGEERLPTGGRGRAAHTVPRRKDYRPTEEETTVPRRKGYRPTKEEVTVPRRKSRTIIACKLGFFMRPSFGALYSFFKNLFPCLREKRDLIGEGI